MGAIKKVSIVFMVLLLNSLFVGIVSQEAVQNDFLKILDESATELAEVIGSEAQSRGVASGLVYLKGINYNYSYSEIGRLFNALLSSKITTLSTSVTVNMLPAGGYLPQASADNVIFEVTGDIFRIPSKNSVVLNLAVRQKPSNRIVAALNKTIAWNRDLSTYLAPVGEAGAALTDFFEPNDDPEMAFAVELNTEIHNIILTPDDTDWFYIDLINLDTSINNYLLTIETMGETDTIVEVFGPSSPKDYLISNDDNGDKTNAKAILEISEAGRYWFAITGYDLEKSSRYSIKAGLEVYQPEEGESNGTLESAIAVTAETMSISKAIMPLGDVDYYLIDRETAGLSGSDILTVETKGSLDTYIQLFDKEGEVIAEDDDSGEESNAKIEALFSPEANIYYIAVSSYEDGETGDYTLIIDSITLERDSYEPDNDKQSATAINLGDSQEHTLTPQSESDWYTFTLSQKKTVFLEVSGEGDTYMVLYNANEEVIEEDDDSGEGYNPSIERELEAGTYYFKVYAYEQNEETMIIPYTVQTGTVEEEIPAAQSAQ